ncbi:flagellar basal body L-ring protein FlgH [Gynuella sunshinyii]|uniref:Flagellar L-ring protein n=1 Tax=Gynuella sunshinyii YC6258 TaxID=1445510 RepID=A0A0C5VRB2_9GAMM|nr:flagellar basal body L-ring protein FlgH [Gynuella sunshinyii]AJQ96776.1 flagellar basal body L-ring protein [Gynuella sunshinyii YC6258]
MKRKKNCVMDGFIKIILVSLAFFLLTISMVGCSTYPKYRAMPNDPDFAPVPSESLIPPPTPSGSIYNAASGLQLYGDKKARRVGDIITIELDEKTVSKKSSATTTKKNSSTSIANPVISGGAVNVSGLSMDAQLSGERDFSGSGQANQSNSLQGYITVTISEILPNGVLRVRGEKWMTLNQGDEYIRISGLVRPEDISLDNMVSSQKLADARISYAGTGTLADSNSSGWLSRFFNSPWFPF